MKEESLLLLSDLQKLINQVVLIDYTIIILGDDLMKDRQFHIYLDDEEYGQVLQALIALKNNLIAQGRYTDAVDDVLIKFTKARKKKITVQYI